MLCTMLMSLFVLVAAWVEEVASDACPNPDIVPGIAADPAHQDQVLLQVGSRKGEVIHYHIKRNATNESKGNGTTAKPEAETKPAAATTTPMPAENSTANATNATKNATCVTRKDERASAWWAATSDEGTPCVFGVDMRDEGKHCVPEFEFGSNGWCYTDKKGNSWGSCGDACPLYGAQKILGDKIDAVGKSLDKILGLGDEDNATSLASDTPKEGVVKTIALEQQKSKKGGNQSNASKAEAKNDTGGKADAGGNETAANVTEKSGDDDEAKNTTDKSDEKTKKDDEDNGSNDDKEPELVTPAPEDDEEPAENETNSTNSSCVTRKDPRAKAWWATTSPPGTPCVFGADTRDEGSHCIAEFEFGTNGWCYTSDDQRSWGSCGDECPLYGQHQVLGKKIDTVSEKLDNLTAVACIWTPPLECVPKFTYKKKVYKGCTMVDHSKPWCANTVKYRSDAWSECKSTCAGDRAAAESSKPAKISLLQVQDFKPWGEHKRLRV